MVKVLITGSNGLLGQHLVSLFSKDSHFEVVATSRGGNRLKTNKDYHYFSLDISDKDQVRAVFQETKPDFVIHGAAMTQVDRCETEKKSCWQINVSGTQNIIEAAQKFQVRLSFISTDFIFDGKQGPYSEYDLPHPINYYGLSKLAGEMAVQGSRLDYSILRTVLVYGVAQDPNRSNLVLWVKKSLTDGKRIQAVDDQWRTPTLIQDLAKGCKLDIEKRIQKETKQSHAIYHLSGKDFMTPYEMAIATANHFSLDHSLITRADASTFSQVAQRPSKTGFKISLAKKELGYHPVSFKEGLAIVEADLKQSNK